MRTNIAAGPRSGTASGLSFHLGEGRPVMGKSVRGPWVREEEHPIARPIVQLLSSRVVCQLAFEIRKAGDLTSLGLVCSLQSGLCFGLPGFVEDTSQLCLDLISYLPCLCVTFKLTYK